MSLGWREVEVSPAVEEQIMTEIVRGNHSWLLLANNNTESVVLTQNQWPIEINWHLESNC